MLNPYEGELVYGSSNGDVVDWLRRYHDWPMTNIMITGAEKSGKSTFAKVFHETTKGILLDAEESLPSISHMGDQVTIIDNAERVDEEWLFHLYNHQHRQRKPLILFTTLNPSEWVCRTADFASRLKTFYVLMIHEPDDIMMRALLFKQLKGQGVEVGEGDLDYMVTHLDRSYSAVSDMCERIVHETLRLKKPLSRSLIRDLLGDS